MFKLSSSKLFSFRDNIKSSSNSGDTKPVPLQRLQVLYSKPASFFGVIGVLLPRQEGHSTFLDKIKYFYVV